MKTLAIGMLFATALVSVVGCHWRHRRDYRDYSNSYHNGDHYVHNQRASVVDRDS
jgi:hypothetical protein